MNGYFPSLSLLLGIVATASAQSLQISETYFSDARFEVLAHSDDDAILTLHRFDNDALPEVTSHTVALAIAQAGVPQRLKEYAPSGQPKGFFRVSESDLATYTGDADRDGIQDRIELKALNFLHPLDLSDASRVDVFALPPLDTSIANDVPAAGAGNIESSHHADIYTFNATADTGVFVDVVSYDNELSSHRYQLINPYGQSLKSSRFGHSEMGPVSLAHEGEYLLLVGDIGADGSGNYAINLSIIPAPQTFEITIGDTITPVEATGAGTIETPGAYDMYTFAGIAGQKIFIDKISYSGIANIDYTLIAPSGDTLGTKPFHTSDLAMIELPETGTYTLQVGDSSSDQTGTYSIAITAVAAPQTFAINIG
ncbi:hypothetical protein QEH59_09890, partial [Coraliomargarita sp. SDUM461004]